MHKKEDDKFFIFIIGMIVGAALTMLGFLIGRTL